MALTRNNYTGHQIKVTSDNLAGIKTGTLLRVVSRDTSVPAHFNAHKVERVDGAMLASPKGWATCRTVMLWEPSEFDVVSP